MKILKRCCIILLALLLAGTMALFGACAEEEPDPGTDPETPGKTRSRSRERNRRLRR